FYSDFKIFTHDNLRFGVGQSSFINDSALKAARERLEEYLPLAQKGENVDMVFYMLTNIAEESTGLMYCGDKAKMLIEHAFGQEESDGYVILNGVVSRKKQVVPALMNDIAQLRENLK
ncbi:MAG: DHHA2 domain-containing protein, partial [Oscillospiraceae bacterium]